MAAGAAAAEGQHPGRGPDRVLGADGGEAGRGLLLLLAARLVQQRHGVRVPAPAGSQVRPDAAGLRLPGRQADGQGARAGPSAGRQATVVADDGPLVVVLDLDRRQQLADNERYRRAMMTMKTMTRMMLQLPGFDERHPLDLNHHHLNHHN